jgi:hypothetical protein
MKTATSDEGCNNRYPFVKTYSSNRRSCGACGGQTGFGFQRLLHTHLSPGADTYDWQAYQLAPPHKEEQLNKSYIFIPLIKFGIVELPRILPLLLCFRMSSNVCVAEPRINHSYDDGRHKETKFAHCYWFESLPPLPPHANTTRSTHFYVTVSFIRPEGSRIFSSPR